jgi:hypothetical protein
MTIIVTQDIGTSVCEKLNITTDQLNSLYAAGPVDGFIGTQVAAEIAARFGLDASEPLGSQLAEQGVLTDDETAWLDDND